MYRIATRMLLHGEVITHCCETQGTTQKRNNKTAKKCMSAWLKQPSNINFQQIQSCIP
jgi:hypothetical protein